ncbi:MAG: DUF177 domain-containing protein [Thermovirgaceae bacterium]
MEKSNGDFEIRIGVKPLGWSCSFRGAAVIEERGPLVFRCELPISGFVEHWGQEYRFTDPVVVDATVSGDALGLDVDIAFKAKMEVDCARCLEATSCEVSESFQLFFKPMPESKGDRVEDGNAEDDENLVLVPSIEGEIDISGQVWEYLVVSLPEKILCAEGCLGLCPLCGRNRNRGECSCSTSEPDPRFAVLAELIENGNDEAPGKGGNRNGNSKK